MGTLSDSVQVDAACPDSSRKQGTGDRRRRPDGAIWMSHLCSVPRELIAQTFLRDRDMGAVDSMLLYAMADMGIKAPLEFHLDVHRNRETSRRHCIHDLGYRALRAVQTDKICLQAAGFRFDLRGDGVSWLSQGSIGNATTGA